MTAILIPVSYHSCVTHSFVFFHISPFFLLWFPNFLITLHLFNFPSTDRPPSLLGSGFTTPLQSPADDRTVFPRHRGSHNSLRAPAREGDTTSTKLVDSASSLRSWSQASRVAVRTFSSTGTHGFSITFSSTAHSVLGDVSSWRINAYRSGLRPTSDDYLKLPLRGQLFSSIFPTFHVSLRTHQSTTPIPARSTSNYYILPSDAAYIRVHTA